jgi:hypothetical protein
MGRPIKPKYIGKYNPGQDAGASVANVTITAGGSNFFAGNTVVTFSAPQEASGSTATGVAVISANAAKIITGITITNAGSGYTSAPTANIFGPANASPAFGTVALNSEVYSSIKCYANVASNGSSTFRLGDILKQKGTKRYYVQTADGTSICTLVGVANASLVSTTTLGQMNIAAFDSAGGKYWVTKLTDRTVELVANGGTQFAANTKVSWNLTAAVLNVGTTTVPAANASVVIDHI